MQNAIFLRCQGNKEHLDRGIHHYPPNHHTLAFQAGSLLCYRLETCWFHYPSRTRMVTHTHRRVKASISEWTSSS